MGPPYLRICRFHLILIYDDLWLSRIIWSNFEHNVTVKIFWYITKYETTMLLWYLFVTFTLNFTHFHLARNYTKTFTNRSEQWHIKPTTFWHFSYKESSCYHNPSLSYEYLVEPTRFLTSNIYLPQKSPAELLCSCLLGTKKFDSGVHYVSKGCITKIVVKLCHFYASPFNYDTPVPLGNLLCKMYNFHFLPPGSDSTLYLWHAKPNVSLYAFFFVTQY